MTTVRERNTSRPPIKLPDINKKSDISMRASAVKMAQCGQTKRTQTNGQRPHRGSCSCCRKKTEGPKAKMLKEIQPPCPPSKHPEIKPPTRPKINWPVAPDCFIPNSVVRSLAPFPPRCGAVQRVKPQAKEEKKDALAESVRYVERNVTEKEKQKPGWTVRKTVAQR